jgi:hypothetical protein
VCCREPWLARARPRRGRPQMRLASVSADLAAFAGNVNSFALVMWWPVA